MCGIAGIIGLNGSAIEPGKIVRMCDEIKHRGPDGEGYMFSNADAYSKNLKAERPDAIVVNQEHGQQIVFGHRRLSIVDLSTSAGQPMVDIHERYWIVFNGEIYNHASLRKELLSLGYQFKTDHSDTEVILNAYACWGIDCLQKFNGMWSFCLWDKKDNTIFMSRDRAGKKPLYYTIHDKVMYFASELKAILVNKEIPRSLDNKAVYDYLTYTMAPSPSTMVKNIFKMPAAHYVFFTPGEAIEPRRYWTPFKNEPYLKVSEEEIAEGVRERMYKAAGLRMIADVEVGVLLSGGLDSSINLACLSKFNTKPIKAFSVGFENNKGYKNEFEYARKVAKHFKADYHELTLSQEDFMDFMPEMIYYQDEPIADNANIPIYYIAKEARKQGVKVLLGGEGSDELFVGYNLWKLSRGFGNFMEGKPNFASFASFIHKNSPAKHKRPFYHSWYTKVRNNKPVFWSGTELRSDNDKSTILTDEFKKSLGNYNSYDSISELHKLFMSLGKRDNYDWMSMADLQYRLPDLLLARLDRMLMAASVEGRNPFLDVNVIEYAMRINPDLRAKNGDEKYILKRAFTGILPDEIIHRKKDSFTVPIMQLFSNKKYKDMSMEAIIKFNNEMGIFEKTAIDKLLQQENSDDLWNITNLAMWYAKFKL